MRTFENDNPLKHDTCEWHLATSRRSVQASKEEGEFIFICPCGAMLIITRRVTSRGTMHIKREIL